MAEAKQDGGAEKKTAKILIVIIILLLLIIVGGAVFFMLNGNNSVVPEEEIEDRQQSESSDGANKEFYYYDVEQPLRVNFPKGSSASLIEIKVAFLSDHDSEDALKKHEPMIVNNLLMTISAMGADQLHTKEGKNELRRRMLEETEEVMRKMTGKNEVQEVFFTAFVMQ
ncbi:flagellar basal body-associated FliL family protein [Methylomarinum vadi]|uniref:flagellar basal body-associated FliL family protein n=1 Tax=Methylomarinum vadi TaxID=438855 RepID=UPI0004DFBEB6|nr:flagellar basal body-associated FliL family protein [Methylomarinum vadi]